MKIITMLLLVLSLPSQAVEESQYHLIYDLLKSSEYSYGSFAGNAGQSINYLKYGEELGEKGTIVIAPGRTEATVKYLELAYDLKQAGYSPIYVISHRGQGLSQRRLKNPRKGYVRHFWYYASDLNHFMNEIVYPESGANDLYLIAHSLGGAIATQYLQSYPSHFKRVVLNAPMHQIKLSSSERYTLFQTGLVCRVPFAPYCNDYIPGGTDGDARDIFEENDVTSSKVRFDFQEYFLGKWQDLKLGSPTYRWVRESLIATRAMRHINAVRRVQVPILLLQAELDTVVENFGQDQFCERTRWCQKLIIEGAKHEILMERDELRSKAMNAILGFLSK